MAVEQKVSNNFDLYSLESNYRSYCKRIYYRPYDLPIMGIPQFPKELPTSSLDVKWTITKEYEYRIDMISYKFYKAFYKDMIWIIMLYNEIRDPWTELNTGREIYVPNKMTLDGTIF